jgi:hypothetical protein
MIFTREITLTLAYLIKDNAEELFPTSKKADANATSIAAWKRVRVALITAHPGLEVTVEQMKTKWSKAKSDTKLEAQVQKR